MGYKINIKSSYSREAWKYFIKLFKGKYQALIWASFGSAAQALLIVPVVLLIKYSFDKVIPEKNLNLLIIIGIAIFFLRLINSLISIWLRNIHIRIINISVFRLRKDLIKKLYRFSRNFHTGHDQKILHTRIVQDTERLANMGTALISRIFPSLVISLALCAVLVFLNWKLLIIIMLMVPVLFLANQYIGKSVKKRVFVFQRAFESFSKGVFFVLKYMDLTVIQSNEANEIERQKKILRDLQDKTGKMAIIFTLNSQVQEILSGLIGIVIIILGGIAVATQKMTLGEFISFYVTANFLNKYINSLTTSIPEVIAGRESLFTLYQLANTQDFVPYQGLEKTGSISSVSLRSVSFGYTDQPVLENINLELTPKSTIAIFGPNSAGKTTIINLILGLYKPSKGSLFADGKPYDELDISRLRQSFGVVMQHPQLFSGTISENILYGIGEPGTGQMLKASEIALADNFIRKLPDGYETQIGEDGVLLSGGECQRLAIARALLRQPGILILDEPTNHLDAVVVKEIMVNLENLENRPAILLISHDMNVVNYAKKIYKLEKGELSLISENLL